jgi:hypothetical protein
MDVSIGRREAPESFVASAGRSVMVVCVRVVGHGCSTALLDREGCIDVAHFAAGRRA